MAKFPEYKQPNYPEIGQEIRAFWEKNDIFPKLSLIEQVPPFYFF